MSRPLVIGLGHTFRGDDGVGPEALKTFAQDGYELAECMEVANDLSELLEVWTGREVIVVDAVLTGREPGAIIELDALKSRIPTRSRASSHSMGFAELIELGRALNRLPLSLWLIGIEAESFTHGAQLSTRVRQSVASVVSRLRERLEETKKS